MINFLFASLFREFLFLVLVPFFIWLISWWGFISGKFALGTDAFYYFWDSRYFFDNISRGVYPLWNPDYSGGVPWSFFLRRLGEFNPFYWTITLFKSLGIGALHAHLAFLVLYFLLGLVGFWLLARFILKDRLTSTAAYLLLLFSWGGQIFYCFDVLMLTPLVWFFYFFLAFAQQHKKHQFLGIFFTLGLMITTYIPFFALTIVTFFLFFFFLFFMKESLKLIKATVAFICTHKAFSALTLAFFILACVPAIDFYLESKQGGFVLPSRHLGSTDPSEVATSIGQNTGSSIVVPNVKWDIIAHGYFDKVFADQKHTSIGDFHIAYPFFIVLILGLINPISRRTALLLVSGVFLTLSVMTKGTLYPFLVDHLFFFRYMRMLQLFFWLGTLPILILMVMEQLRVFLHEHAGRKEDKVLAFIVITHLLFIAWLYTRQGILWSSYLAICLSLVFFVLSILGRLDRWVLAMILWVSLMVQPIETVKYISQEADKCNKEFFQYHWNNDLGHFLLAQKIDAKQQAMETKELSTGRIDSGEYYENPWIYGVRQAIYSNKFQAFVRRRLVLFDNTSPEDDYTTEKLFIKLSGMWGTVQNLAFVPLDKSIPEDFQTLGSVQSKAKVIYEGDAELQVLAYDANTLRLKTNLDRPKFLLWTNGYHAGWHIYIDGQESRLLRADYAFKGAWIPAGEHQVMFRFGTLLQYVKVYLLLFAFAVILILIFVLGLKEGLFIEKEVAIGN